MSLTAPKTQPAKTSSFIGRLLLISVGLLAPFLALELGVRLVGLAPPPQPNPSIWEPHPLFGWWHVPYSGGTFHSDYNEFTAKVQINARRLRDREIGYDNPNKTLRVLSLADSFGEALQVNLEDTYHKQLEGLLTESLGRPVEVINAGVGGWGTDQEAIFYLAEGFRYQPDIVLLSFFIRNDVVNNYGPLELKRNGGTQQKQFFTLAVDGTLIPPDLETEAKAETEAEPPANTESGPLIPLADTLWQYSALYRFIVPYLRDIPPVVQKLGPSGILGGEGVVRASHPTTPIPFFVYQDPPNQDFSQAWALTEAIISQLQDEVESRGSHFVVIIIGAPEQVSNQAWEQTVTTNPAMQHLNLDLNAPNRRLNQFLTTQNIAHLDLLPIFRKAVALPKATAPNKTASAKATSLHLRHDQHWTTAGHRLAAESIHQFLLNQGIVK